MIATRESTHTNAFPGEDCHVEARPRILHLINYFESGGTERQAVELLKRLDRVRFNVYLAALRNTGPLYQEIASLFPTVPEFPLTSFYDANTVRQVLRLRALLVRERIDIIHAHDFYAGMLATMAAPFTRSRVIACQRNLQLSHRRTHRWGQWVINQRADLVLVNAEAIRDSIVSKGGISNRKIKVIRNGLVCEGPSFAQCSDHRLGNSTVGDFDYEVKARQHDKVCDQIKANRDALLVGMVANFRLVKGHKYLIEAASFVVKRLSNVHFVLIGEGELRKEIEDQIARLGIGEKVHLLGYRSDTRAIAAAFDVAVLTSMHEGLPNAVIEAMSVGCPVVASRVGGIPELINDGVTGVLVEPGDVEALSDRIVYLLMNKSARAAIGRHARDFVVNHLSMDRMVKAVELTYDNVLMDC